MTVHPFNRELLKEMPRSDDGLSVTGQFVIGSDPESNYEMRFDASYILRNELESAQRRTIELLAKEGHKGQEILTAAKHLRDEYWSAIESIAEVVHGEDKLDYGVGAGAIPVVPEDFACWLIYAGPDGPLEVITTYYVEALNDFLKPNKLWTWGDIFALVALWSIDESVAFVNLGQPYKAAAWGQWAQLYATFARDFKAWSRGESSEDVLFKFSKEGLDKRHAANRQVKAQALELYQAQKWRSQADAARRIAPLVHRTELVVTGWIREYRKKT
jgi:hypothetical protein